MRNTVNDAAMRNLYVEASNLSNALTDILVSVENFTGSCGNVNDIEIGKEISYHIQAAQFDFVRAFDLIVLRA